MLLHMRRKLRPFAKQLPAAAAAKRSRLKLLLLMMTPQQRHRREGGEAQIAPVLFTFLFSTFRFNSVFRVPITRLRRHSRVSGADMTIKSGKFEHLAAVGARGFGRVHGTFVLLLRRYSGKFISADRALPFALARVYSNVVLQMKTRNAVLVAERAYGVEVVDFSPAAPFRLPLQVAGKISFLNEWFSAVCALEAVGEGVRFHVSGEIELGFITRVVALFAEPPVFVAIEGFEGAVVGVDEMGCQLGLGIAGERATVAGELVWVRTVDLLMPL